MSQGRTWRLTMSCGHVDNCTYRRDGGIHFTGLWCRYCNKMRKVIGQRKVL